MLLLVRLALAMFDSVLFAPLMVLFVRVCVAAVDTNVTEAGIVVPLSVVAPELVRVVNAPVDADVAPTVVPLIEPPVMATLPIAKVFVMSKTAAPAPPPFVNTTRDVLGATLTVAPEP